MKGSARGARETGFGTADEDESEDEDEDKNEDELVMSTPLLVRLRAFCVRCGLFMSSARFRVGSFSCLPDMIVRQTELHRWRIKTNLQVATDVMV